jgi:hypothetical protein
VDTLKAVIIDVRWFLVLLLITMWGFSCAFYILFRQVLPITDKPTGHGRQIWHADIWGFSCDFYNLFRHALPVHRSQ